MRNLKSSPILLSVFFLFFTVVASSQVLTLDPTFGNGKGYVTTDSSKIDLASKMTVLPDGKISVIGFSYTDDTRDTLNILILRYHGNGYLDSTFGLNGILNTGIKISGEYFAVDIYFNWVVFQPDGKIVILKAFDNEAAFNLFRFNADGSADPTFGNQGKATVTVPNYRTIPLALNIQTDGKILAAGALMDEANMEFGPFLVRLNTNGSLDNTFNSTGISLAKNTNYRFAATCIIVQKDGKIIVGGSGTKFSISEESFSGLARFNANGSFDASYGTGGFAIDFEIVETNTFALFCIDTATSEIYIVGQTKANIEDITIRRYSSNGYFDNTFKVRGNANYATGLDIEGDEVTGILVQPGSKLLLAGNTTSGTFTERFLHDGRLDTTFANNGIDTAHFLNTPFYLSVKIQPDGKFLFCGAVASGDSTADYLLVRKSPVGLVLADANITATSNISATSSINIDSSIYKLVSLTPGTGSNGVNGTVKVVVSFDTQVTTFNGVPYVQRKYDITPATNANSSQALIKLYFTQQEFDNYNSYIVDNNLGAGLLPSGGLANGNVRIHQFHGSFTSTLEPSSYPNEPLVTITPIVQWNTEKQWWEVEFPVSGFSGFFLTSVTSTLPLDLIQFSAKEDNNQVQLRWKTSNERNTKEFLVERRIDNKFYTIGVVPAFSNSGNHEYKFTDTEPLSESNFYRLKMVDKDARFNYSEIVLVKLTNIDLRPIIYPNPSSNIISFAYNSRHKAKYSLQILNVDGKVVKKINGNLNIGENLIKINLSNFNSGIYILQFKDGEKISNVKFIKN